MSRGARSALALLGAAVPVLVGLFAPVASGPTLCTFRNLTGYDCPGCGLTRSVVALLHGDPRASWAAHPLGAPLFVGGMALWIAALWGWAARGRFRLPLGARTPLWALVAGVAIYLGVYVLRLSGLLGGTVDPPAPGLLGLLLG